MKIKSLNRKNGKVSLRIDSPEDLWHLRKVVEKNDVVSGKSSYKQKIGNETERQKSVRKTITISIKVSKISFDKFSLRVQGKVESSSLEEVSQNEFHSIEISPGEEITICKRWKQYQIDILKEAEKNSKIPKAIICSLDDSEANLGEITSSGVSSYFSMDLELTKKRYASSKKDNLLELAKKVISEVKEKKVEILIIASPLFWKDELRKRILTIEPSLKNKILTETVSTGSTKAFKELLTKDSFGKVIAEAYYIKEEKEIENLLSEIALNSGKSEYGFDRVENISLSGAIQTLLVSENLLSENFVKISKIIDNVEKSGGKIIIFESKKEAGKRLDGLGGIAAILRYAI